MIRLSIRVAGRSCPVAVGRGAWRELPGTLRAMRPSRVFVLTHGRLRARFGAELGRGIRSSGHAPAWLEVPQGESSKSPARAERLWRALARSGADRGSALVLLGGGVVLDLGGFVASTFARGLRTVALPTTALGQADACLGGKTALDLPEGKNLVGTFWHPHAILCDTSALDALPLRQWRSGLAEIVKCAAVADAALFARLERQARRLRAGPTRRVPALIARALAIKARIVAADPADAAGRARLNFGHTAGHAYEAAARGSLSHGEAVSRGMVAEARLGEALAVTRPGTAERLARLLSALGLPTGPFRAPAASLRALVRRDKKRSGGSLRLGLTARIGGATVFFLSLARLEALLRRGPGPDLRA